jgi:hypothetical protein
LWALRPPFAGPGCTYPSTSSGFGPSVPSTGASAAAASTGVAGPLAAQRANLPWLRGATLHEGCPGGQEAQVPMLWG